MEIKISSAIKGSAKVKSLTDLLITFDRVWKWAPDTLAQKALDFKADKDKEARNTKYVLDYITLMVKSNEIVKILQSMVAKITEIDNEILQLMKQVEDAEKQKMDAKKLQTIKKRIKELKIEKEEVLNFGAANNKETWKDQLMSVYTDLDTALEHCEYAKLITSTGRSTAKDMAKEMSRIFEYSVGFGFTENKGVDPV